MSLPFKSLPFTPLRFIPLSLTRRGAVVLIAAAAVWASWFVIGLRDLWYLVALLAALVVVGVACSVAFALFARVEVRVSVTHPTPAVGETVVVRAAIRHRLPFALEMRVAWGADAMTAVSTSAAPREMTELVREWVAVRRGEVSLGIHSLAVLDPLGLAAWRIRPSASVDVLVLPRMIDAFAERIDGAGAPAADDSGENRDHRVRDLGHPGSAVREYRAGDARREIHWKQSARQGEFLVRLRESSDGPERTLLLATDPASYGTAAEFELAVSATASLGAVWIRNGYAVNLVAGASAVGPMRFEGECDLLRRLATVGLDESTAGDGSAGSPGAQAPDVVIAGAVTPGLGAALGRSQRPGVLLSVVAAGTAVRAGGVDPRDQRNLPHGWTLMAVPEQAEMPAGLEHGVPSRG